MKYKVDEWVGYCSLPDIELFKDERELAVVLDILDDDIFYDYKIYIEKTGKIKKVREHQLFSGAASYVLIGMALNMFKKLLLVAVSLVAGCQQPDYAIVTGEKGETVFVEVEVPGETVYVEVPEYIEVEVPVEHGEIWIDSFTQPMSVDGIDILWVIDRSGSMSHV